MTVTSMDIQKFSVFRKPAHIEFSPGINVFMGANGSGKTHLMKLLYSVLKVNEQPAGASAVDAFNDKLARKIAGVYKPDNDAIGRLVSRQVGKGKADISLSLGGKEIAFSITTQSNLRIKSEPLKSNKSAIFLPSREVLAMYEGFIAAYQSRELAFEETYYDLCVALSAKQLRGPKEKETKKLLEPLEKDMMHGTIRLDGERFYLVDWGDVGARYEAHLMAEGIRKIAGVAQLLQNGSLMKHGYLFWDEPEANLNPRLVTQIASMLRILADWGVQIFISTHDYLLTRELSLAVEYKKIKPRPPTRFFCLNWEKDTTVIESGETLADLNHNPILEEFSAHYEREEKLFFQ